MPKYHRPDLKYKEIAKFLASFGLAVSVLSSVSQSPLSTSVSFAQVNADNLSSGSASPASSSISADIVSCLGSSSCQIANRDIYQRAYLSIIPEYILQLRPELCLDVNIHDVAEEIRAIEGVSIIDVYDLPGFQAVSFRGYPGPTLLNDDSFVDYNATAPDINAEIDRFSGHNAQLPEGTNATQLDSSQVEPSGLERTFQGIPFSNFTSINLEGNNTAANTNNTNVTNANASSIAPAAENCAIPREVPVLSTNVSAAELNVDIAVLDTGVSLTHPDLNVYRDVTFVNGTLSGDDDQGHGSHVAGIAAAKNNELGIVGIAPGARIWAIKVCDSLGECKITNQIKGIEYAIKHADEIDVLNISIENPNSPALNSIINAAVQAGITVVASAGNYGKDASLTTPANNPNVLTVSAVADSDGICGGSGPPLYLETDDVNVADDTFAFFSNFGPVVSIAAPGVNILSTYNGSGYAVDSGTSMAAPFVSGAATLYKAQHPFASPSEVMDAILGAGSTPTTICDGAAHGYFTGDLDALAEPLLYHESISSPISAISPAPSG